MLIDVLIITGTFARLVADHLGSTGSGMERLSRTSCNRSPIMSTPPTGRHLAVVSSSTISGTRKIVASKSPGTIASTGSSASPRFFSPPLNTTSPSSIDSTLMKPPSTSRSPVTSRSTGNGIYVTTPPGRSSAGHSPINILPAAWPTTGNTVSNSTVSILTSLAPVGTTTTTTLSILVAPPHSSSRCANSGAGGIHRDSNSSTSTSVFTCDICTKTFTSRSNLNKHKRVQHSGEEYTCPICKRTFKNRYYVKEHVQLCSTSSLKKAAAASLALANSGATASSSGNVNFVTTSSIRPPGSGGNVVEKSSNLQQLTPLSLTTNNLQRLAVVLPPREESLPDDEPTDLAIRRPVSPVKDV